MNMMKSNFKNKKLILIGINEVNFEFVKKYAEVGKLPNFSKLINTHGLQITKSESEYDHLEPWIQWVTVHTGKDFAEHQIFRLGDIMLHDHLQIWEYLELHGLKVGAISPMNASNKTQNAAFFLPDPWTATPATGGRLLTNLSKAVHDVVNENAVGRISLQSAFWILASAIRYIPLSKYRKYTDYIAKVLKRQKWAKAQILDELLFDVFKGEMVKHGPDFSTLFLNAAAHIQHHYMFNSSAYKGEHRNPDWLISQEHDPVFDVYNQYDRLLSELIENFPQSRLLIVTGLHQDPYPEEKYYWRLVSHEKFLRKIGVNFESVQPLMSRDFVVHFASVEDAELGSSLLENVVSDQGIQLFEVDNRGKSLFVMLTYPHDVSPDMAIMADGKRFEKFLQDLAFVAIKNGEHNGEGYLIDTSAIATEHPMIPLSYLPTLICDSFGVQWRESRPDVTP